LYGKWNSKETQIHSLRLCRSSLALSRYRISVDLIATRRRPAEWLKIQIEMTIQPQTISS